MKKLNYLIEAYDTDKKLEELASTDVCYTWEYSSHKPNISIFYCDGRVNKNLHPKIGGYKLWLSFFCDYSGYFVNIYYPIGVKKWKYIGVIFIGSKVKGVIEWQHGEQGLFDQMILPLLFIEKKEKPFVLPNSTP